MDTELQRMFVRIMGDASSVQQMAQQVKVAVQGMASDIRTHTAAIGAFTGRLQGFARSALSVLGTLGIATSAQAAFDAYSKLDRGQIQLNTAIEAGGHDAAMLSKQYAAVAESIARVTLLTKGETMAMFRQAEVQGFSGDAAERVVRNAVALSGATGQEASSLLRATAAMERGNYQLIRRQLRLQGVKDETELVAKVNQMMVGGMAAAQQIANTASGRIEKLGKSLRFMTVEVGGLIAKAILPFLGYMQELVTQFKNADPAVKAMTAKIVLFTLAFFALPGIISTIKVLLTPVVILWHAFVVVLTVSTAVLKFLALSVLLNVAAITAWKLAVLAFTVVWNIAAAVVAGGSLAVAAIQVAILIAAFVVLYSAVMAIVKGVQAVVELFGNLGFAGVGSTLSSMFRDWWEILKKVFETLKTDAPQAMNILVAGFALAVSQIRDLWTPLWSFIRDGFINIASTAGEVMWVEFKKRIDQISYRARHGLSMAIGWESTEEFDRIGTAAQENIDRLMTRSSEQLRGVTQNFAVVESEATRTARNNVRTLIDATGNAAGQAEQAGFQIGAAVNKGMGKEMGKFNAILAGSAEAVGFLQTYADQVRADTQPSRDFLTAQYLEGRVAQNGPRARGLGAGIGEGIAPLLMAGFAGGLPAGVANSVVADSQSDLSTLGVQPRNEADTQALLREIRDAINRQNGSGVSLVPARLRGGSD